MFAFVIWDSHSRELFIARDRVGKKPLYYYMNNTRFFFASEIKSLFANKDVIRELDPSALDQLFTFWTTLPGNTLFKNIHELSAGPDPAEPGVQHVEPAGGHHSVAPG